MRVVSYLINTARGPIIDEKALVRAVRDGTIAGAAPDVLEYEPAAHPDLLGLEQVVLCPHLGSATIETRAAMGMLAARNAIAVLRGEAPPTPVNGTALAGRSGDAG